LAIRWGTRVKGGRVVEDFVSLSDLAPTFLAAAGLAMPREMTARSLLPVLFSDRSGQVDPARDHTLTGMEVHVPCRALPNGELGGYPMRTILTTDFHYIRNFRPDRWASGDPAPNPAVMANFEGLARNTLLAFADIDASPTKAWIVVHRDDPRVQPIARMALGKRPARQLFDLRQDPYELKNVADDPAYAGVVKTLDERLMSELKATGDPRAQGRGDEFDGYGDSGDKFPTRRPNPRR
jgi:arylsulfatase A-like enzyme